MVWLEGLDRVGLDRRFGDQVEKWTDGAAFGAPWVRRRFPSFWNSNCKDGIAASNPRRSKGRLTYRQKRCSMPLSA